MLRIFLALSLISGSVGAQSIMYDLWVDGKNVAVITSVIIVNDIVAVRTIDGLECTASNKEE